MHSLRTSLTIKRRYLSNSLGDSAVIRDCAFLYETLPGLAACGSATSFDVDECLQRMCEHASAALSAAVSAIIPVPRCFEVFAADFIVSSSGRPWLLEARCCSCALALWLPSLFDFQVNADPSWALWQHEQPALQARFFVLSQRSSHVMRILLLGVRVCCTSHGKGGVHLHRCRKRSLFDAIAVAIKGAMSVVDVHGYAPNCFCVSRRHPAGTAC